MSIAGILGVTFVTLKIVGVITWPWIWVTAPFWGALTILILFFAIAALIAAMK